ncbi:hypothetical protein MSAN_00819400 [Mycena sanguinolenta]|uniref:F-box domain-containing protein n=1 Tax=Mycena sanguinolenta TaxID=230812 RepID=A0A8H6YUW3_9AGAR|nr:hypothetical protein MSAN_00819400 [Mycena sanguinolenta]
MRPSFIPLFSLVPFPNDEIQGRLPLLTKLVVTMTFQDENNRRLGKSFSVTCNFFINAGDGLRPQTNSQRPYLGNTYVALLLLTPTAASVRAILIEQTERTGNSSKADIQRFIEESELKMTSLGWRDRERACIDSLRYIISPICTLPIELLVEIFRLAIDDETHIEDAHRISQICSDWRKIAHATPRLWTGLIYVDLGSQKIFGREQLYADGLTAWLARSAPLPVPISLELYRENSDPCIVEEVFRIAPRISSLHCPNYLPLSLIRRLAECRLDSLEELELGLPDSDPNTSEFPALTTAPRLRKSSITISSGQPHILVPWAQLTDLTLDCDSIDVILDILPQCAILTCASLITSGWSTNAAAVQLTRPPLTLSHLHTLSLEFTPLEHMREILGVVTAPALEILHLNFQELDEELQSPASLAAFLMQSPNITQLEIICGFFTPTSHELIVTLEHTVRLTHLKLVDPYRVSLDHALIAALSYKENSTPLVPRLRDLVLADIDPNGFATAALENMFFSRWWTDTETTLSPRTVSRWSRLELQGIYSEEFTESMKVLQRKGLPLELRNSN